MQSTKPGCCYMANCAAKGVPATGFVQVSGDIYPFCTKHVYQFAAPPNGTGHGIIVTEEDDPEADTWDGAEAKEDPMPF